MGVQDNIRRAVWGDFRWRPAWQAKFDELLARKPEYGRAFDRLVKKGCDATWLCLQLASYTKPADAAVENHQRSMKAVARQLLKLAASLEDVGQMAQALAAGPHAEAFAEALVNATLLSVLDGSFHEHLTTIADLLRWQAKAYRVMGDERVQEHVYKGQFLKHLVEGTARSTGKKRLGNIAVLINAAAEAHGRRWDGDEATLKKRLKDLAAIRARHGIGSSLLDVAEELLATKKGTKEPIESH